MLPELKFYQIAVLAISALMIYFGLEKFIGHKPNQSLLKVASRLIIWGGMATIALFPSLTNTLAHFIGLEGNINAVILLGFLLVFLIIFKILSVVERIEQDISTLIRKDALQEINSHSKRHEPT